VHLGKSKGLFSALASHLRKKEKQMDDPAKKEKEARVHQAMERYRSIENSKQ